MRNTIMMSIILASCSSRSSEASDHTEAVILHNSMMRKANQIEHRLHELREDISVNKDSVVTLLSAFEQWENDLVEVPGSEEHDHSHEGHSHTHNIIADLTAEQILEIQQELDQRLNSIKTRLENFNLKK